jgi:tRNA nucleotidyltransferase (CCA-adding enzyme)
VFEFPAAVTKVCALLWAVRTRVLVVVMGGAIVDLLSGRDPVDYDLEAHGLSVSQVCEALVEYNPKAITAEHNGHTVVKCTVDGVDIDIATPDVDEIECARRRDLTINSLFYNVATGCLIDHFGGRGDLAKGILRATSEYFRETPANVLRVAQFLSRRKGRLVHPETKGWCKKMAPTAISVPGELVKTHMDKLLLGEDPVRGLLFLHTSGWLEELFPELYALVGLPEKPEWHPEGHTWLHTLGVVANAARVCAKLPEEWRLAFMWAALLHDVGKAAVDVGTMQYRGHDAAGAPLVEAVMLRLRVGKKLTEQVVAIVSNHMQPGGLTRGEARIPAWKRLHNKCRLDVLGWHSRCDWAANPAHSVWDDSHQPSKLAFKYFEEFGVGKIPPKVQGRDLLRAGETGGPHFRKLLDAAYQLQIEHPELTTEELVERVLADAQ